MRNIPFKPLTDHFDRVFIINLRDRADRRRQVAAELARIGESIDSPRVEIFPAVRPSEADGFPSIGIRGCFLSHCGVIARAAALKLNNVLVLEDDVCFTSTMRKGGWPILGRLLEKQWDIAFLGHGGREVATRGWRPVTDRGFGTHCFAVRASCFESLLEYMRQTELRPPGHPDGGKLNADALYTMFRERHPVTALQCWPTLAIQRPSASDISPKWFDRVAGLRRAASVARVFLQGVKI